MPANTVPLILPDATITFSDATTPTPLDMVLTHRKVGLTLSDEKPGGREPVIIQDKDGAIIGLRHRYAAERAKWACQVYLEDVHDTAVEEVRDWVKKTAGSPFASRVNTNTIGDLDTWTIKWEAAGTYAGGSVTCTLCTCDSMTITDAEDGTTLDLSGTVYGTITDA